jgi:hypothetical protein
MDRHDLEQVRLEITRSLPQYLYWAAFGVAWTFDFSRAQCELLPGTAIDLVSGAVDPSWSELFVFGEEHFDGGASPALAIHVPTGEVRGLDVEREASPVFLLNSGIRPFIETIRVLDRALRLRDLPARDVAPLLEAIDPAAFRRSEWRDLTTALVEHGLI